MQLLFVIFYTLISEYPTPCPDAKLIGGVYTSCLVNHGMAKDTSNVEMMTTNNAKVNEILLKYPNAIIDTFLLLKYTKN